MPAPDESLAGRFVTLDPLDRPKHLSGLWEAFADAPDSLWTYLPYGPFRQIEELSETLDSMYAASDLRQPYAIVVDGVPVGFITYLRVKQSVGVAEIGAVTFSPRLQRTAAATEAIYLLIANAFALGYRRVEWKCDSLNEPSAKAARRFGFSFEGTFRKIAHYKGRTRDTHWFSIVDDEWPALQRGFQAWLSPDNFDETGMQRQSLGKFLAE